MRVLLEHLPEQTRFYECTDDQAAFVGGLGYGKTHAASDILLTNIVKYPKVALDKDRPGHFIFSNTYPQLTMGTMKTFFEACDRWGIEYRDHIRTKHIVYLPRLDAPIGVWSVDKPINFKSLEICFAWIDEAQAWSKDAYDKVLGRLRGTATQRRNYPDMPLRIRITANPPKRIDHWLVDATTKPDERTGRPPITLFTASTYDNPFLTADYIHRMESMYDPEEAEIELGGKYGDIARGRVFRRFSRSKHLITPAQAQDLGLPPLTWDASLPVCWSHDFNIDPLCSVLFQWRRVRVDGYQTDVMFVLDEIRIRDSIVDMAVDEFLNREASKIAKRSGLILYGDASGNSQGNRQTGLTDFATLKGRLAKAGFVGEARLHDSNPPVPDRARAANRMLENARHEIGVVMHKGTCKYLPVDLERMYWKPGTFIVDVPKPKDGDSLAKSLLTHLGDAFSYPIEYEYPITEERA